jgi:hypothetical protein
MKSASETSLISFNPCSAVAEFAAAARLASFRYSSLCGTAHNEADAVKSATPCGLKFGKLARSGRAQPEITAASAPRKKSRFPNSSAGTGEEKASGTSAERLVLENPVMLNARRYLSPRGRALTPDQVETRRIAYALKEPDPIACLTAAKIMAPILIAAEPNRRIVLMPVPTSAGSTLPNRRLAAEIIHEIGKLDPARSVAIQVTVARRHPVESSCQRRRRGLRGLPAARHAIVAVSRPPVEAAAYFLDNVITEGTTVAACRSALGHGNALVWAAK